MLFLAALFCSSAFFNGCSPYDVSGNKIANVPPVIQWAMIPQDSIPNLFNPTLKWYGKDIDGQMSALVYQYVVALEGAVESLGGPAVMAGNFPADLVWTSLGSVTSAKIPLFASPDTSVYVDQYVFMRCQDDKGDYSNIIYLYTSRNNHPPTCHIFVPQGPQWCLPDTSDYWHGISVSWEGKDSLDYTGFIQPDFLWKTRIYGPFADSVSADTLSQYLYNLADPETGDSLTSFEQWTFNDLRTGWYLIYSVNFDDAFVPAIQPAMGIFNVYEPNWIYHPDETKDVLIVNHSNFANLPGLLRTTWRDSVMIFYQNLMADVGIASDKWDWSNITQPPPSTLYNYRMVIVDNNDWSVAIGENPEENYSRYLDVGGKIWVNGRFNFANIANQEGRLDYGENDIHPLAYTYMDLSGAYFPPGEAELPDSAWAFTAEFVGALPLISDFPILEIDTVKVLAVSYVHPDSTRYPYRRYEFRALPKVEYLIRNVNSETIYQFNAVNPDTSRFHGFPVAIRNENAVFKSSCFSFPLFFIKYDQAKVVANDMIDWFLDRQ